MSESYPPAAQSALEKLYSDNGVAGNQNPKLKIAALDLALGGKSNFYAAGGTLTDEIKVKCLELQYLELNGLVKLELA